MTAEQFIEAVGQHIADFEAHCANQVHVAAIKAEVASFKASLESHYEDLSKVKAPINNAFIQDFLAKLQGETLSESGQAAVTSFTATVSSAPTADVTAMGGQGNGNGYPPSTP